MRFFSPRLLGATMSISALCLCFVAPAGADVSSVYPPQSEARDFAASQGGWTASTSFESCPLPITCPTVANTFEASGGAGNDGHIRSSFEATLAILGTATATWLSPGFVYSGAGGEEPTSLSLGLSRRADVSDLLDGIAGSSATYSVVLVDETEGGATIPVMGPTSLAEAGEWATVPAASVDPGLLTLGNEYAVRISSTYVPGAVSALVEGSADYDNVVLAASRPGVPPPANPDPGDKGGGGGAGGTGGAGGAGGSAGQGALTAGQLRIMIRRSTSAAARLRGKRLLVRLACPRNAQDACRITAQGRIRKGLPVTHRRTVAIAKGKSRLVALRVKRRFRDRIAKRKRLLIFQVVRVGDVSATFSRSRTLIGFR
jgi:hypothetical protein